MTKEWIGCDLDGTLAHYEAGDLERRGSTWIGAPIPLMVERVKRWLAEGRNVRIFTARVSTPDDAERARIVAAIHVWCVRHLDARLEVTCVKDWDMLELYDDRAVSVEMNTGRLIGKSTRGMSA